MALEESQSEQKQCPMCAEDIKQQAKVCHFCGAEFEVVKKGYCGDCKAVVELTEQDTCSACEGGEVIDRHYESTLVSSSAAPSPATTGGSAIVQKPGPTAVADTGEFKEGIGLSNLTWLFLGLARVALIALFMAGLIGFILGRGVSTIVTGTSRTDWFLMASSSTEFAVVPIALPVLAFLLTIFYPNPLFPGQLGLKVGKLAKHYSQERKKLGFKVILKKKRFMEKWIISMALWSAIIAMLVYNYFLMMDEGLTTLPLFNVLAICGAVGFTATILIWPLSKKDEVVQVDRDGNIYKR